MTNLRSRLRLVERRAEELSRVSEQDARLRAALERAWKRVARAQVERYRSITDEEWRLVKAVQRRLLRANGRCSERLQEVLLQGDRHLAERFEEMGEIEVAKRVLSMSERLTRAVT